LLQEEGWLVISAFGGWIVKIKEKGKVVPKAPALNITMLSLLGFIPRSSVSEKFVSEYQLVRVSI
jgi:hypothetical protein